MENSDNKLKITVLGSGTSVGVPVVGCPCDVCNSGQPRNCRTRSSVAVEKNGTTILVDTAPELRLQSLAAGLDRVDAVVFTHEHADHIMGLDDLRIFNYIQGKVIPLYGNAAVIERLKGAFSYIWDGNAPTGGGKPLLELNQMNGKIELGSLEVESVELLHGKRSILGFVFGPFAYLTDCSAIPEQTRERVRDIPVLILGALRYRPHTTHFNLEAALSAIEDLSPERAYLTHLSHSFDYYRLSKELPRGVEPAYDGLVIEI